MLNEIVHIKQIAGEPRCRWFKSEDFALFIWQDNSFGAEVATLVDRQVTAGTYKVI